MDKKNNKLMTLFSFIAGNERRKVEWIVAIVCIVAVVSVLLIGKFTGKFDVFSFFGAEPKIDKTANVVESVKATAEFTSMVFYDEFVLQSEKEDIPAENSMSAFIQRTTGIDMVSKDVIVLVCKGKVRAGFDLKKVQEGDITVYGDTLNLTLPQPEIFDVILNPSDIEVFSRSGEWTHEQTQELKVSAEQRLRSDAEDYQILEKAKVVGLNKLTAMYKGLGFRVVNLEIKQ